MNENLIAFGRAEVSNGPNPSEQVLGHASFTDNGSLHIAVESADGDPQNDILITFPASTIDAGMRKKLARR